MVASISVLLALCLPAIPALWKGKLFRTGGFKAFAFYFAWCALTIAWSLAPGVSMGRLAPDILLFLTLIVVLESVENPQDLQRLFGLFIAACAILLVLFALTATVFPVNVFHEGDDPAIGVYNWYLEDTGLLRFSGIFNAPNEIGSVALAVVGAGLYYLYCSETGGLRSKVAVVGCVAASFVFNAMADSRSTFLAIAIGVGSFLIWRYRGRGLLTCFAIVLAGAIAYAALGGGSSAYLNRDVTTLTGRTEAWEFETAKVRESPLLGYGYAVEGAIFQDRYFPNWEIFWDRGANTPLHNGYLSVAIGVGLPALIAWIVIFLRPWIALFRYDDDPWNLKPIFFFVVLPMLVLGFDETGVAEPRYVKGLLLFVSWMLAERWRLEKVAQTDSAAEPVGAPIVHLLARRSAVVLVAIAIAAIAAQPAFATEYYVDSAAGSDSLAGTSASAPWQTLSKVNSYQFRSGDIVRFRRGSTWREMLEPHANGNFRGVTFTSYGNGNEPVINGSDLLTGWARVGGAIYAVHESEHVYNVFVDGEPGWGLTQACCVDNSSGCTRSTSERPPRNETCAISSMQPGSWHWSGPSAVAPEIRNTLYVWLPDGGDAATHSLEAVTRPYGFHGWTRSHELDSLAIDGLEVVQTGLSGISLESEDLAGRRGSGKGLSGLVVRNCLVERTGTGQIDDGSYGNGVTIINATAPLVENNVVSYTGNHGNSINVQNSNSASILHNTVDHWNHNGIDVKGSADVLVKDNQAADQRAIGAAYYVEYSYNVIFRYDRAETVHNGFQIALGSSAVLFDNTIDFAGTAVYLGPRAMSLSLRGNRISRCAEQIEGDVSGTVLNVDGENFRRPGQD